MMGNNVIRAEGKPKFAMYAMLIPSIGNLVLDYIFIYVFDWGMAGAAWATTGSYIVSFLIAGFNFGAEKYDRVKEVIYTAIKYATILGTIVFAGLMFFPEVITQWFTDDQDVIKQTPNNMRLAFAAVPIIAIQLIGAAYFQAVGKALPALLLTLTRQAIFFIPLLFILPKFYGELGVWIVTVYFLKREVKLKLNTKLSE